jgi:hypothetical protein
LSGLLQQLGISTRDCAKEVAGELLKHPVIAAEAAMVPPLHPWCSQSDDVGLLTSVQEELRDAYPKWLLALRPP